MRKFLYFELILVVILGFAVSYKYAEKASTTKKEIYTTVITKAETVKKENPIPVKVEKKGTIGKVFKQYGYVFLNNKKSTLNAQIAQGDIIKTSSYSYVILKFSNGAVLRVNPNSEIKVENLENNKNDTFKINILLGSMLSHFSKKGKYTVNTETATVGVRGTTFYTEALTKEQTVICPCMGTVDFYDDKDHKQHIVSDHHHVLSLTPKGFVKNVDALVPDVLRQHNDDGIAELKVFVKQEKSVSDSTFDYTYSKNSKILKKALDLIKNKKGGKAIFTLSKIGKKDMIAAFLIGKTLYEGNGIKQNKAKGVKWLKISAKGKFPSAVEYLAGL